MSTKIGGGSEKIEFINDVADVITDTTVEAVAAQAPAMDEVAAAAADSYFPVAALQHVLLFYEVVDLVVFHLRIY
jgi:YidC/Oxa1 family membrane protein insertase